jgi:hypothetical protein
MERYGVAAVIGEANMYATLPTAVEAYREWAAANPAAEQPPVRVEKERRTVNAHSTVQALGLHRFARVIKPRSSSTR